MEAFCKTLHLSVMQGTRVKCQMTSVKHAVPMTLAIHWNYMGCHETCEYPSIISVDWGAVLGHFLKKPPQII